MTYNLYTFTKYIYTNKNIYILSPIHTYIYNQKFMVRNRQILIYIR